MDSLPAEPPGKPKNTGVGSLSLLQWIFPTQESNWGILHCRLILYQLSCQGIPAILEWVAIPSFRGSSQPKDQTQVSHIAGSLGAIISWSLPKAASPPTTNQLSLSIYYVKGVQRWILKIRTESPLILQLPVIMKISGNGATREAPDSLLLNDLWEFTNTFWKNEWLNDWKRSKLIITIRFGKS